MSDNRKQNDNTDLPTKKETPDVAKPVGEQGESRPEDKGRPAKSNE
jgi:hypothetical protein